MMSSFVQTCSPLTTASDSRRGISANCSRTTVGQERRDRLAAPRRAAPAAGARGRSALHAPDELEHLVAARHERDDEVVVADLPDLLEPRLRQVPRVLVVEHHRQAVQRLELRDRLVAVQDLLVAVGRVVRVVVREAEGEVRRVARDLRHGRLDGRELGRVVALVAEDARTGCEKMPSSASASQVGGKLGPRRPRRPPPCARPAPTASAAAGRRRRDGAAGRATASGASRTSSSRSGCPTRGSSRGRAAAGRATRYSPDSTRSRISVPVGALASKSRFTTASSCSRVSRTEKSRSALKLEGKTSRPWPLTTKGLMLRSGFRATRRCPARSPCAPSSRPSGRCGRPGGRGASRPRC